MAVRSNYIKSLMESKDSLEKKYQEVVTESMKSIIGENAKNEVRKLLKEAEDEDSFEEEDVDNTDTADNNSEDEVIDTEEVVSDDDTDETNTDSVDGEESVEGGEEETDDDDLWNDLEKCKSADGEYDCRGMDDGSLLKVLQVMGPEDGIRVMSNGDGTVEIEVDGDLIDGQQEFVIDLDDFEGEDIDDDSLADDEEGVEIELNEENLGYKGNPGNGGYQKKTAFTLDSNESPTTDRKKVGHTWEPQLSQADIDNGKDGNTQPYTNKVNEDVDECDTIYEIEQDFDEEEIVDEGSRTVTQNNSSVRGVTNTPVPNSSSQKYARNGHVEAQSPTNNNSRGTGDGYKEATNESVAFKKKVNRLWEENKQMKSIIPQLQEKIMESMLINASMGYIVRLLNENSTTVDEKKKISERFTKVNTLEESKKLYETISEELRTVNKRNNIDGIINSQLAEGKQSQKQSLVETTMYKSDKVNGALDFMNRLDKIK